MVLLRIRLEEDFVRWTCKWVWEGWKIDTEHTHIGIMYHPKGFWPRYNMNTYNLKKCQNGKKRKDNTS